jgi:hypothetical protein
MSRVGGGAFAVQGEAHGSAPATRAEPDAVALAAAFGVQETPHASSATTGVDLRSLEPGRAARTSASLTGILQRA